MTTRANQSRRRGEPPPTEEEVAEAVNLYLEAERANGEAYRRLMTQRERLVEMLHRIGLDGFHL
jgi:hypothetical protein